ncbi:hypothetical protein SNOG_13949 [Parastagonospora nodorum SN15]|uniref:Uncharacterized protein n=1 Tax=Phaeosphaeria nodorum (strain SN15 / ATCC MYA-4574 / FGSC 10173) TaxID=321614 RepID=Q0U2S7_PHANO|nr:hypothetical protein SNOG_13949 [Parastagonospora nodorum SN15]EAT78574.2 hypothetical protein SNOG_13949 [Parastagonospora nodorum SN15]
MGTPPPATYSTSFFSTPVTPPAPEIKTEDSPAYYNTSSCVDAANIIRNMRVDEMQESDTDLGFRVRNQNCYVNSNMVFNMMDKYSTQHSIV